MHGLFRQKKNSQESIHAPFIPVNDQQSDVASIQGLHIHRESLPKNRIEVKFDSKEFGFIPKESALGDKGMRISKSIILFNP